MDEKVMAEGELVPVVKPRHSGMGVASFATSVVAGLLIIVCYIAIISKTVASGGTLDKHSSFAIISGMIIMALLMCDMIALGLGIAGIIEKNRKRIYAILGIIISAVMILMVISLTIVGLMSQAG